MVSVIGPSTFSSSHPLRKGYGNNLCLQLPHVPLSQDGIHLPYRGSLHFQGRGGKTLSPTFWWNEFQDWHPRQRAVLEEKLEALRNKGRNKFAYTVMAMSALIPLPKWLYRRISKSFYFSPRKAMGLKFQTKELNEKIFSASFQLQPNSRNLENIHSFYLPAKEGKPTIAFFHGRNENIGHLEPLFKTADQEGLGFFAIDYPGFGKSDGIPTEEGLKQAGVAACRFLAGDGYGNGGYRVPYGEQIIMGYSLGGAVAVHAARQFAKNAQESGQNILNLNNHSHPRGLVVANSFTSIKELFMSQLENTRREKRLKQFKHKLFKFFNPNRVQLDFNSKEAIQEVTMPVNIFNCPADKVVPPDLGIMLKEAAKKSPASHFHELKGHGHEFHPVQLLDIISHKPELFAPTNRQPAIVSNSQ
jgi:pimeloyl-ACP methyl ester carboxylesterase